MPKCEGLLDGRIECKQGRRLNFRRIILVAWPSCKSLTDVAIKFDEKCSALVKRISKMRFASQSVGEPSVSQETRFFYFVL